MKTNVIFKSGLNLVCDNVSLYSTLCFLYKHEITDGMRTELMNECLKNEWEFSTMNDSTHPNCMKICVRNNQIERFCAMP